MAKVYFGLGSNIGDKKGNIRKAISLLKKSIVVKKVSPFYETEPVGYLGQEWFVNCVIEGVSKLPPDELLKAIEGIEEKLGKKVIQKNGPRTIDIDILLYGSKKLKTKTIEIPHPRFHQRAFVLIPFAKIAPKTLHPVLKKTIKELLEDLDSRKEVRISKG